MPNLQPPITTVAQAITYRSQLQAIEPNINYLMSLYLHSSIMPEVIDEAAAAGIAGVKVSQGVTTNSSAGVTDCTKFFPVFAAMEKHELVLNLHGEVILRI
jgi:dihydroorotase